jgi:hypothetical protein
MSRYASARASTAASPAPELPESPELPMPPEQQQIQQERALQPPPQHRMSCAVKTVGQLWREWTVGLGGGSPAISVPDSTWGSRWRAGRRIELQWYSLRLEAINEIRRIAQAQRCSETEAMWQLYMQQQRTGYSLDQLCKRLRANRKKAIVPR